MTVIEVATFKGCSGLKSVTLSNVAIIDKNAFNGCTGLETITLPSALTNIADNAFSGCKGLKSIYAMPFEAPQLNSSAFADVSTANIPLYVHSPENYSGWPFNIQSFATMALHKQSVLGSIDAAMQGVTLPADDSAALQAVVSQIKALPDGTPTREALAALDKLAENALAIANYPKLRSRKDSAIAAIEKALEETDGNDYLTQLAQEYITNINAQTKEEKINAAKDEVLIKIPVIASAYNDIINAAFGTLGTKQNGPAVILTDKDDKEFIFYSPKSVEYIKVKE